MAPCLRLTTCVGIFARLRRTSLPDCLDAARLGCPHNIQLPPRPCSLLCSAQAWTSGTPATRTAGTAPARGSLSAAARLRLACRAATWQCGTERCRTAGRMAWLGGPAPSEGWDGTATAGHAQHMIARDAHRCAFRCGQATRFVQLCHPLSPLLTPYRRFSSTGHSLPPFHSILLTAPTFGHVKHTLCNFSLLGLHCTTQNRPPHSLWPLLHSF